MQTKYRPNPGLIFHNQYKSNKYKYLKIDKYKNKR